MFSHFTLDNHLTVLFKFINIQSNAALILTCLAFLLLSVLYEGLRCLRMNLARRRGNYPENSCLSAMHAVQTFLHLCEVSLGYVIMLVVMSYNGWLFLAVVLGLTIGLQFCVLYSNSHHDGGATTTAVKVESQTGSGTKTPKAEKSGPREEEMVETTQLVASV